MFNKVTADRILAPALFVPTGPLVGSHKVQLSVVDTLVILLTPLLFFPNILKGNPTDIPVGAHFLHGVLSVSYTHLRAHET